MIFGKNTIPNIILRYLMDFLIVFSGVYLAFLFNTWQVEKNNANEREKILSALKGELELFRLSMKDQSDYQKTKVKEWREMIKNEDYSEYYSWRYLEPQYNYRIIEYALNKEGTDIIDFELFKELKLIYNEIRQLEHAEQLMTHFANQHDMNPSPDGKKNQNRFYFYKFVNFANDRANIQERLGQTSVQVLQLVNERLSETRKKEVETEFMCDVLQYKDNNYSQLLRKGFPEIPEDEWQAILERCGQSNSEE